MEVFRPFLCRGGFLFQGGGTNPTKSDVDHAAAALKGATKAEMTSKAKRSPSKFHWVLAVGNDGIER